MIDFNLPKELIAQVPARPRNSARLLVYKRSDQSIKDDYFYNLDKYLHPKTTLVLNDSKVEKCRLKFGNDEVFITDTVNPHTFKALVRPGRKFKPGRIYAHNSIELETIDVLSDGQRIIKSNLPINHPSFNAYRLTPLPPYIAQDESLKDEYQTVYADPMGSKASPTAGLHFTNKQLQDISKKHQVVKLTLHVGLGTFMAPTPEQIKSRRLHEESYSLSEQSAQILNMAKHITTVGTTSLRTLESIKRPFHESSGKTDIFIMPGHKFKAVDSLITNFHLPGTSLLLLVSAFIGSDIETQKIYDHAIQNKYRFYSFGDAMLIL